ncbi:MAG: ammonium transporter [Hellea sp.]|nr:ammonium transporter [Hellea sp.]
MKKVFKLICTVALLFAASTSALAQTPTMQELSETVAANAAAGSFVLNSLLFLIGGFLVMWMAAGFAMLEAGMVRTKNVSMQCLKNIMLYSVAGLMFWAFGYNILYGGDAGGFIGSFGFGYDIPSHKDEGLGAGYTVASDWFFQMVFCATTASIVSGTVAERVKFWPFIIFVAVLTGLLYPITAMWQWGGGWLSEAGFSDFAGSTLVHSVGGWAALAGAIVIGARKGKYVGGRTVPILGSSIPLATLGVFILWLGWFGFNGGSQLAMGTIEDVSAVSKIFVNTNLAAAGGVVSAVILTQLFYKKIDVTMALNGALAGLVAITAEPLTPSALEAILIGGVGGLIVVLTVPLLDKVKIDDVVGAIPVHLFAGIFGTLVVALNSEELTRTLTLEDGTELIDTYYGFSASQLGTQALGVVAIGAFIFIISLVLWSALKMTTGVRISEEDEYTGLDQAEIGVPSYPEFVQG